MREQTGNVEMCAVSCVGGSGLGRHSDRIHLAQDPDGGGRRVDTLQQWRQDLPCQYICNTFSSSKLYATFFSDFTPQMKNFLFAVLHQEHCQ